jgi:hypothetical protein
VTSQLFELVNELVTGSAVAEQSAAPLITKQKMFSMRYFLGWLLGGACKSSLLYRVWSSAKEAFVPSRGPPDLVAPFSVVHP